MLNKTNNSIELSLLNILQQGSRYFGDILSFHVRFTSLRVSEMCSACIARSVSGVTNLIHDTPP